MKQFLTFNFRYILLAVGIIITIILLKNGCGSGPVGQKEAKVDSTWIKKYDSLQVHSTASEQEKGKLEKYLYAAVANMNSLKAENQELKSKLTQAIAKNTATAKKVILSKENKDTASYVSGCDDLAKHSVELEQLIFSMDSSCSAIEENYQYRLGIKDSIIHYLNIDIRNLKSILDYGNQVITKPSPLLAPRTTLFLGASVIGNKTTIFSGYGADLSLLNKKGMIYHVGTKWINGAQFFEGGFQFRLSFNKH